MNTPDPSNLPVSTSRLSISLAATGWAACIGVWFVAIACIAIFATGPMALPALVCLFAGGLVLLVVLRLIGTTG